MGKQSEHIAIEEMLQERIKELSCLYKVSSALRDYENSVEDTFRDIIFILKDAWRFPNLAIVVLKYKDLYLQTETVPREAHFQVSSFKIDGKEVGHLKVFYPANADAPVSFLIEEQKLLDKVAYELALFLERQKIKQKEELLKRTAERNDRLSILGEITAGVAHELNTPLGNILGFAEFIENQSSNLQVKTDAGKIIKSALYSREVVKKLMIFSCEVPQNIQVIEVKPVIDQALALLKPNFKKAGIRQKIEISEPQLEARVDPIQLTQVIFNLIINAIYHAAKDSCISVKISNDKTHFFLVISDEGLGVKPENRDKIFEPFFTTKPLGEGSGLGLSVVHGIIKSHRGEISVLPNNPKGTTFKIKLPLNL